ncbi:PLDc N-terminal domain-containing protein [Sphingobacterium sp. SYP-B4668]|uniref:PLDc N-terminal domain-containing protein n=1 Tax=Sphingobacterium sp. SYP-B4668 TaxID=2996035 RepID=UPI0022DE1618|nr:PLDc N-terminal domain-containing protein [Sphingobacterium sp. SYP-B4668]
MELSGLFSIWQLLIITNFVLQFIALYRLTFREQLGNNERLLYFLVMLVFPFIGSIYYLIKSFKHNPHTMWKEEKEMENATQ